MAKGTVDFIKCTVDFGTTVTLTQGASTVDVTNDNLIIPNHNLKDGDVVGVTSSTTLPTGLSADTGYYVIKVANDRFALATTRADATAGTKVNITATGSGTLTVRKNAVGEVELEDKLPVGAIVTDIYIDETTTVTVSGSSAFAVTCNVAQDAAASTGVDIVTGLAVADFAAGTGSVTKESLSGSYEAIKVTTDTPLLLDITTAAVTAGVLDFFIQYIR